MFDIELTESEQKKIISDIKGLMDKKQPTNKNLDEIDEYIHTLIKSIDFSKISAKNINTENMIKQLESISIPKCPQIECEENENTIATFLFVPVVICMQCKKLFQLKTT